jgi:predicted extracellular nuclease
MKRKLVNSLILFVLLVSFGTPLNHVQAQASVFINEIHYDNASTDVGEAVEVAGPAGMDLTGWSIIRYNGANGQVYTTPAADPAGSDTLSGTIPDLGGGFGVVMVNYAENGLQNGAPDGVALVDSSNEVVQFLSYEGTFTAVDGPASGMTSVDIGVSEAGTDPLGYSLQLTGTGTTYEDFVWAAAQPDTFDAFNTGQSFSTSAVAVLVINEIDYDQPSTDTAEYVEIKNVGTGSADLSEYTLELVNGTGGGASVYQSYTLPALSLAAGDYFVVCGDAANVANCDLDVFPDSNLIQNGAPDAVGLRLNGELIDAVSYEGDTGAPYTEGSGIGLEDDPDVEMAGISRYPDGTDTDANNVDFSLRCATPGQANTDRSSDCVPNTNLVINEIDYDQPSTDTAEFVEIRNNGDVPTVLTGWTLELVNGTGGGATVYATIDLSGFTLAADDYFVVCGDAANVANCDLDVSPDTNLIQNGAPDAVGLRFNGTLIDAISYEGDTGAPYTEGSGAGLEDNGDGSISRCPDGTDTDQNNVDFVFSGSSTPGAANACADAAPEVASTYPVDGATDFPVNADLTVTFSEPVNVTGTWFDLSCFSSGSGISASVSGGPTTFTLDPSVNLVDGESCTLTIYAANVSDQDSNDPPDNMDVDFTLDFTPFDVCAAPYTPIYEIQGSGPDAAITGNVTTKGVVVGDYEGPSPALRGFYIQDVTGDGDAATSDGIFVFNGNNDDVNLGDVVSVTGSSGEYQGQTQISSVSSVANCGTGSVTPVDVNMPFPSATYLEQFEGMLVRFPQTLYVTEHFQLGRFGQVLLSSGGRLRQPTNVVDPGAPALDLQAQNDLNKIILDDDLNNQNPDPILFGRGGNPLSASNTLRGGDTATGIVGIMTYTWSGNAASGNAYRLRPINALGGGVPNFQPANPRPVSAPAVGGSIKVAGMNLLNFFNTFDGIPDTVDNCTNGVGGAATDCRGADTQAEFDRQWPKTVAAILAVDADVIGVNEIENDGYGPDSAIAFLVDRLNDATAPGTYAFIDVDANTGQVNALGTDAIKVGLIYRPASVTPVGQTAALNTDAFVNGGDSEPRSRPSLAQAFEQNTNGGRFIVDVNHLKSKGSACDVADAGDGQGNCNIVRVNAATELVNWLATDPTGIKDADILLIGDYNSYAIEDPITIIKEAGFTNLIASFLGPDAYSYVFDGQWGYLDHALGSSSVISQVTGVGDYHINSDEPSVLDYNTDFKSAGQIVSLYAPDQFRVSDHDPVLVGLNLIHYNFDGFFRPIDNAPAFNKVKGGSSVPVKFSLDGDQGLSIFLDGYPQSQQIDCESSAALSSGEPTVTAGESSLAYDPLTDQYNYVWKTDEAWAGTCRQLVVILKDGSIHYANFSFK